MHEIDLFGSENNAVIFGKRYKDCKEDWRLWADVLPLDLGSSNYSRCTTLPFSSLYTTPCKVFCKENLDKYLKSHWNSSGISDNSV